MIWGFRPKSECVLRAVAGVARNINRCGVCVAIEPNSRLVTCNERSNNYLGNQCYFILNINLL
jgi:hypothetical protein